MLLKYNKKFSKKRTHKSLKCSLTKFFDISAIANHNAIMFNFCILANQTNFFFVLMLKCCWFLFQLRKKKQSKHDMCKKFILRWSTRLSCAFLVCIYVAIFFLFCQFSSCFRKIKTYCFYSQFGQQGIGPPEPSLLTSTQSTMHRTPAALPACGCAHRKVGPCCVFQAAPGPSNWVLSLEQLTHPPILKPSNQYTLRKC